MSSLFEQALSDNSDIITNDGTVIEIEKIDNENIYTVSALVNYIGFSIDPGTGQAVSGSEASCTINLDTLVQSGLTLSDFLVESKRDNLIVRITVRGIEYDMRIIEPMADRSLEIVLLLELTN